MSEEKQTEVKALKAEAYDCIAAIEYAKNRLAELNQKISELSKETHVGQPI